MHEWSNEAQDSSKNLLRQWTASTPYISQAPTSPWIRHSQWLGWLGKIGNYSTKPCQAGCIDAAIIHFPFNFPDSEDENSFEHKLKELVNWDEKTSAKNIRYLRR